MAIPTTTSTLFRILKDLPSLKLTSKAPENRWLEDYFPFGKAHFQGRTVSFNEGIQNGKLSTNQERSCNPFLCLEDHPRMVSKWLVINPPIYKPLKKGHLEGLPQPDPWQKKTNHETINHLLLQVLGTTIHHLPLTTYQPRTTNQHWIHVRNFQAQPFVSVCLFQVPWKRSLWSLAWQHHCMAQRSECSNHRLQDPPSGWSTYPTYPWPRKTPPPSDIRVFHKAFIKKTNVEISSEWKAP